MHSAALALFPQWLRMHTNKRTDTHTSHWLVHPGTSTERSVLTLLVVEERREGKGTCCCNAFTNNCLLLFDPQGSTLWKLLYLQWNGNKVWIENVLFGFSASVSTLLFYSVQLWYCTFGNKKGFIPVWWTTMLFTHKNKSTLYTWIFSMEIVCISKRVSLWM